MLTMNMDGSIESDVRGNSKRYETLTVVWGVITVGMETGDQPEEDVTVIFFRNVEEGGNWRSSVGGLVRLPYNGRVGVLDGGELGEEDLSLHCLEVRFGGGFRRSKERGVPRDIADVAYC